MRTTFSLAFLFALSLSGSTTAFSHAAVRKTIKHLTADNFSTSLEQMEPYLTKEAGRTLYTKSLKRLAHQAKQLGLELPTNYAKEAKCTEARRAKQDAFIQAKEEERLATEAAAAEATEAMQEPELVTA